MSDNTLTITFRAKRTEFSGGWGYRMPRLTGVHMAVPRGASLSLGDELMRTLNNERLTTERLRMWTGLRHRSVIFEDKPEGWNITPVGSGYMADVSITVPLVRNWQPTPESTPEPAPAPAPDPCYVCGGQPHAEPVEGHTYCSMSEAKAYFEAEDEGRTHYSQAAAYVAEYRPY